MSFTVIPILASYGPFLQKLRNDGIEQMAIVLAYWLIIRIMAKRELNIEDLDDIRALFGEIGNSGLYRIPEYFLY
jgi:hypothetical protein